LGVSGYFAGRFLFLPSHKGNGAHAPKKRRGLFFRYLAASWFYCLSGNPFHAADAALWFTSCVCLHRFDFAGKRLLRMLTMLPFILPHGGSICAFNALLGPRGWINLALMQLSGSEIPPVHFLNSFSAILVAHVFYNISIVIRVVGGTWSQLDPRLEQSASVLGASPGRYFKPSRSHYYVAQSFPQRYSFFCLILPVLASS
jgi:ABC-type sugar transport system permease subunit